MLQEMNDSGGMVSACVNAACLALLDACVPMRFLVAAVTCCVLQDGSIVLDPSFKQQTQKDNASLVFVFDSRTRSVISTQSEGRVTQAKLHECLVIAKTAVEKVFQFYKVVIGRKFSKDL